MSNEFFSFYTSGVFTTQRNFFLICELAIVLPGREKLGTIQEKLRFDIEIDFGKPNFVQNTKSFKGIF